MKLIIQIPCLNERNTLQATVADLPRSVEGFDSVEFLVVDDGSTDGTAEVARSIGVDHVVQMNGNKGLARAFMVGLFASLERGADVIVNTDADNQYEGRDVATLVRPILEQRADLVIGARPIGEVRHFSPLKRLLQRIGSRSVRALSGARVADAPCGFRAMTRETALRLNVFGRFTYTIETIIQAGKSNLRVTSVPIRVNGPTRPSRLFQSNFVYIGRSILTMLHAFLIYRPGLVFGFSSAMLLLPGLMIGLRYLWLMANGDGRGHVQSVVACAILILCGALLGAIGVVAHLMSINRRLLEEIRFFQLSRLGRVDDVRAIARSDSRLPRQDARQSDPLWRV